MYLFTIEDIYGSSQGFEKELIADEIQSFQELKYDATFNYGFTSDASDSALFRSNLDIRPVDSDLIPGNTIVSYDQKFSNYYAYDDGSA